MPPRFSPPSSRRQVLPTGHAAPGCGAASRPLIIPGVVAFAAMMTTIRPATMALIPTVVMLATAVMLAAIMMTAVTMATIPIANRAVAVGTRLTPRPPHRSERALLTHSAPALDV